MKSRRINRASLNNCRAITEILIVLFFSTSNLEAQFSNTQFPVKGNLVTVTGWGSRSLYIISDAFFTATKDSIVAQIGEKEFGEMQYKCSVSGWPAGFYRADLTDEEDKAFEQRLNQLKMFRIAAYTHVFNGKTFERYVILRIPYEENRAWDPEISWDGNIYFLLKEKDVREKL